jgi:hypothetical protein
VILRALAVCPSAVSVPGLQNLGLLLTYKNLEHSPQAGNRGTFTTKKNQAVIGPVSAPPNTLIFFFFFLGKMVKGPAESRALSATTVLQNISSINYQ